MKRKCPPTRAFRTLMTRFRRWCMDPGVCTTASALRAQPISAACARYRPYARINHEGTRFQEELTDETRRYWLVCSCVRGREPAHVICLTSGLDPECVENRTNSGYSLSGRGQKSGETRPSYPPSSKQQRLSWCEIVASVLPYPRRQPHDPPWAQRDVMLPCNALVRLRPQLLSLRFECPSESPPVSSANSPGQVLTRTSVRSVPW